MLKEFFQLSKKQHGLINIDILLQSYSAYCELVSYIFIAKSSSHRSFISWNDFKLHSIILQITIFQQIARWSINKINRTRSTLQELLDIFVLKKSLRLP